MRRNIKKVVISTAIMSLFAPLSINSFAAEGPVINDAYISIARPTQNFGSDASLMVDNGHDSYIRIDLSTLPPGTTGSQISHATLRLWVSKVNADGIVEVSPVTSAWDENTLTGNAVPRAGERITKVEVSPGSVNQYVIIDLTDLVKMWADNPAQNFGVVLHSALGAAVSFESKEAVGSHGGLLDITLLSTGEKGDKGDQGIPGVKGEKGDQGIPGVKGDDGALNAWSRIGNASTIDGVNFIGTTDNVPFNIRVANLLAGRIDPVLSTTYFGLQAGAVNTSPGTTAIGTAALRSNTTGGGNTAVGFGALAKNTTGAQETAVGAGALQENTTGLGNTAVGNGALTKNTTGKQNVAVGASALQENTTANDSVAIGTTALQFNTTGFSNIAVGSQALRGNTTGAANTATGFGALLSNTTGSGNVANGYSSLSNNTTGNFNVAVGEYAQGQTGSASFGNTAVGYQTIYQLSGTSYYNTAIGYNAMSSALSGISNSTAIGANAYVTASNMIRLGDTNVTVIQGQVGFTAASDSRLKEDIQPLDTASSFIMKLHPVSYRMKNPADTRRNWGFIAQDIESLLGTDYAILTVSGDTDRTLGLRYTDFIAPMVKTIQEQQAFIKALEQENKELRKQMENEDSQIKSRLANLKAEFDQLLKKIGGKQNNSPKR